MAKSETSSTKKVPKDPKKSSSSSKKAVKDEAKISRSTERISLSDLDDDEESQTERISSRKEANAAAQTKKSKSQSSPAKPKPARVAPPPTDSTSEESSEEEDEDDDTEDSSEDEESEEEEESLPTKISALAVAAPARKPALQPPSARAISKIQATAYSPPAGFEMLPATNSSQASKIFNPANLEGKQIWYITAPASVPISAVKKVSLQDVQAGKVALSYDGQDYGFVLDTASKKTSDRLLVPDDKSKRYRIGQNSINQTLHLQQMVKIPSSISPSSVKEISPKPIRQQPSGLKMRFRPIGFGMGKAGVIGSSSDEENEDEDMEDAQPTFRAPAVVPEDESMDDAPAASTPSSQKSKKRKLGDDATKSSSQQPEKTRKSKLKIAKQGRLAESPATPSVPDKNKTSAVSTSSPILPRKSPQRPLTPKTDGTSLLKSEQGTSSKKKTMTKKGETV